MASLFSVGLFRGQSLYEEYPFQELAKDLAEYENYGYDWAYLLKKWKEYGKNHYPVPTCNKQGHTVFDFKAYAPLDYTDAEKEAFAKHLKYSFDCATAYFEACDNPKHPDHNECYKM
jgi:hypothetical protein